MLQVSVSVTAGVGSERHNHDIEFRSTLEHVTPSPDGVIELIEYVPYNQQINEIMKPYIDQYNRRRDFKYEQAFQRYEQGHLKCKPKKQAYEHMDYNYAEKNRHRKQRHATTGRVEEDLIYRSLIISIGDQSTRAKLKRQQVIDIFKDFLSEFQERFKYIHVLAATIHLDEVGAPHLHLDTFPLYPKNEDWIHDLPVYRGLDKVLKMMGYLPEQSIITAEEKQPLLFNTFRNRIYLLMQTAMEAHGLYLQYGVSEKKYPYKDPSQNMRLEVWKDAQNRFIALQQYRNEVIFLLNQPEMQLTDFIAAIKTFDKIKDLVEERSDIAPITLLHGYRVTSELMVRYAEAARYLAKGYEEAVRYKQQEVAKLDTQKQELISNVNALQTECERLWNQYQRLNEAVKILSKQVYAASPAKDPRERDRAEERAFTVVVQQGSNQQPGTRPQNSSRKSRGDRER